MRFFFQILRTTFLSFALIALTGCNGSLIFLPQNNERIESLVFQGDTAPYRIQVMLNEKQHQLALSHLWHEVFRLEGYSTFRRSWSEAITSPPTYTGQSIELSGASVTGLSYRWLVDIDLYDLGLFNDPGSWGTSFKFRMFVRGDNEDWEPVPALTVNWQECYRMTRRGYGSCPFTFEVHLRGPGYIPNVTRGDPDCGPGSDDCSACVKNVMQQVGAFGDSPFLPGEPLDITSSDWKWTFEDPVDGAYGFGSHNQGVARLSDTVIDGQRMGRMVITANPNDKPPRGFFLGLQKIEGATEGVFSRNQHHDFVRNFRIMGVEAYGNHNHPGGIQAHGNVVAIAMEEGKYGAVYFLRVDGDEISLLHTLTLDGSQREPEQRSQASAATVGFVKLESGYFLLAVSGSNHGKQGIWFYESSDTVLNPTTRWHYVDFYRPTCVDYGNLFDECYVGAGGGLNLVTECSGDVYLLAMHGTSRRGKDYEFLQVFRLEQAVATGRIQLDKVAQQRDDLQRSSLDDESFRWTGGAYVTSNGGLAIMNSERRTRQGSNDSIRGHIYIDTAYVP